MQPLRLIPLGTNGLNPSPQVNRQTMSFLVLSRSQALLLDAGTGAVRLLDSRLKRLIKKYKRLDIVLSHYHPDHTDGLTTLVENTIFTSVRIFAPTQPLVDKGSPSVLKKLYERPRFNLPLQQFPGNVEIIPYRGNRLRIGSFSIALRRQEHGGGSVGMRIGNTLAYCPDTATTEAGIDFIRDTKLVIHEAWVKPSEKQKRRDELAAHTEWGDLAKHIAAANVRQLMPVHFHPLWSTKDMQDMKRFFSPSKKQFTTIIPQEGKVYSV